jgi:serine-type D-Ala-D-Ala carboxypeptidase (penicillin-binding protein 5/6)
MERNSFLVFPLNLLHLLNLLYPHRFCVLMRIFSRRKPFSHPLFSGRLSAMYGSLLSVLLLGIVPVWGARGDIADLRGQISIAPPAILAAEDLQELDGKLTASGIVIIDLDSAQTVYAAGADSSHPMASLTKLMTALLIVEHHSLDETVAIPPSVRDVVGNTVHLPVGQRFTVGDLLSAMLIPSANDAAIALAEFHSKSADAFVQDMNDRAVELGLSHTSYANPVGLDDSKQLSSPRDLAWLATYVFRHESIRTRMALKEANIASLEGTDIYLAHSHQLLDVPSTILPGSAIVTAGKTGTTDNAGQCLLSLVEVGGRRYVTVLLGSSDRYSDMQQVLLSLSR